MESKTVSGCIVKLDKFVVPNSARDEFLPKVMGIMELLKSQPGYIQGFILEQPGSTGEFNLVTLVEWENKQAAEGARGAVIAMQEGTGVNPQETMAWLVIGADTGLYTPINAKPCAQPTHYSGLRPLSRPIERRRWASQPLLSSGES